MRESERISLEKEESVGEASFIPVSRNKQFIGFKYLQKL